VIPLLLMLAATDAPAMTPIEAERAFAADAQKIGQWTAFRKWAAPDATMFIPQPANAHEFLKDKKDPPKAIDWWPTASWISCDGKLAVNTGGWTQPNGSVGYFTTVWQRQPDGGWKWIVDGGDDLKTSRDRSKPKIIRGSCQGNPTQAPEWTYEHPSGRMKLGSGSNKTLVWQWSVLNDGTRQFNVWLWNGKDWNSVIDDKIAPAK
jgi:hypothetical protein